MIELEEQIDPLRRLALQDFSYSRITSYEDCQAKYFYSYILKKPQEFGPAATLGNIIHKALEITLEDGQKIDSKELLDNYESSIPEFDPELQIPADMIQNGRNMLTEFVESNQDTIQLYAKELPFSFVLGRARINGFIDFVAVYDSHVLIRDYKSGAREVAVKDVPTNLQLGIYSLYAKHLFPDKDIYAELYYLKSGRVKGHLFTEDDLSLVETELSNKINSILDSMDFKHSSQEYVCNWCSYAKDGTCPTGQRRLRHRNR